jgi:fibro-slime domain-containing protein
LKTEAVLKKPGSSTDTAYRAPLNQILSVKGSGIAPPARIWLRAIFYDFNANKTNPEFEPWSFITNFYSYSGGIKQGMIESKLTTNPLTHDANAGYFGLTTLKKPRRKANTLGNRNCNLDKWFVPWTPGNTWGPRYTNSTGTANDNNDCTLKDFGHDTAWKNVVVKDSIPFDLDVSQGPNTYVFSRVGYNATPTERYFFWLDSLAGLPSEPKYKGKDSVLNVLHNFGWCMEMHSKFLGDDDVWLFINDSLVIDLGGMHGASTGEVNLDDLRNLQFGKTYPLDFFYCERKRDESSCRIITNIPAVRTTGNPIASWKRDYGSMD